MAFKLTKAQIEQLNDFAGKIREEEEKLQSLVDVTNAEIQRLYAEDLAPALAVYNELLERAQEAVEVIASDLRGEFDDKSDSWKDGDRGQAVDQFIQEFESVAIETIELSEPEDTTLDFTEVAETLEGLPQEIE